MNRPDETDTKQRLRDAANSGNTRLYLAASLRHLALPKGMVSAMDAIIHGQICSLEDKVSGMWGLICDEYRKAI